MFGRLTEFLARLGTGHDLPLGPRTTTRHHHFVHLLTVTAMKRDLQISQFDSDPQYSRSRKRHCTKPSKTGSRSSPTLEPLDLSYNWTTSASSIYSWTIKVAQVGNFQGVTTRSAYGRGRAHPAQRRRARNTARRAWHLPMSLSSTCSSHQRISTLTAVELLETHMEALASSRIYLIDIIWRSKLSQRSIWTAVGV
jgi:hypothetical protein